MNAAGVSEIAGADRVRTPDVFRSSRESGTALGDRSPFSRLSDSTSQVTRMEESMSRNLINKEY